MRRWLTVLAACVAAAVIATLPEAAVMLLVHDSPRPATVITAVTIWLMWGALFGPAVYFGCRRAARMRGGVALIVAGSVPLLLAYRIASSAVASLLGGGTEVTTFFQPVIVFVLTASYALLTVNEEQRIEAERRRADADLRFASARLERLRAELQPHFLFNAINTISALAAAEPDKAARVCGDLRDLFRATALDELPHVQPVEDELALTRKYLDIQQARFDERLRVHFDVDPSARERRIPALLLQPLVENAFEHGMSGRRGIEVTVTVRRHADALSVSVANSGPVDSTPIVEGIGLANTRARLAALYGDEASLSARRHPEGGFAVDIRIPADSEATS